MCANVSAGSNGSSAEPETPQVVVVSEYDQYFETVTKNPMDFTTWTQLLSVAEKEVNDVVAYEGYLKKNWLKLPPPCVC